MSSIAPAACEVRSPISCSFVDIEAVFVAGHSDEAVDFPYLPVIEWVDFGCAVCDTVEFFEFFFGFQVVAQFFDTVEIHISTCDVFDCRPVLAHHIREEFSGVEFPCFGVDFHFGLLGFFVTC